jgi:integrase
LKNKRARTVPLVPVVVPIVNRWSAGKRRGQGSSPLRRVVRCGKRTGSGRSAGVRRRRRLGGPSCAFTICATRRLRCGWRLALIRKWSREYWGHATAAMTMDLYRHMIDRNLWDTAQRLGGTTGARPDDGRDDEGGALAKGRD